MLENAGSNGGLAWPVWMGAHHPQVPSMLMWKPGDPWMLTYRRHTHIGCFFTIPSWSPQKNYTLIFWWSYESYPHEKKPRAFQPSLSLSRLGTPFHHINQENPHWNGHHFRTKAVLLSLETPFSYSNPLLQWWLNHVKPPFQVVENLSLSLKSHLRRRNARFYASTAARPQRRGHILHQRRIKRPPPKKRLRGYPRWWLWLWDVVGHFSLVVVHIQNRIPQRSTDVPEMGPSHKQLEFAHRI